MYIDISDIPFFPSSYLDNVLLNEGSSLGTDHFGTACFSTSQNSFSGMVKKGIQNRIFLSLTKLCRVAQLTSCSNNFKAHETPSREEKHLF